MWPVNPRILIAAAVVLSAFAAGWLANGWRLNSAHATELRKMYESGLQAYQSRDERAKDELAKLRQELGSRAARPIRRVYLCPDVPGAASGAAGAGETGSDSLPRLDAGPILGEARDSLLKCNALIGVLTRK